MPEFTDTHGKTWTVALNVGLAKQLRKTFEIDVFDLQNGGLFDKLIDDPITLVGCLYLVCAEQIEAAGLSEHDFAFRMGGDTLGDATDALLQAVVELYPERRRPVLHRVMEKAQTMETRMVERAIAKLDSSETDEALEKELAKLLEE